MFYKADDNGFKPALPGIRRKTLTYGESTLFTEFRMEKGRVLPRHSHPHEQTGYLVRGKLILAIGNDIFEVGPGDSWCINADVEHSAEIVEDTVAIEVFSPVREDYLPENT